MVRKPLPTSVLIRPPGYRFSCCTHPSVCQPPLIPPTTDQSDAKHTPSDAALHTPSALLFKNHHGICPGGFVARTASPYSAWDPAPGDALQQELVSRALLAAWADDKAPCFSMLLSLYITQKGSTLVLERRNLGRTAGAGYPQEPRVQPTQRCSPAKVLTSWGSSLNVLSGCHLCCGGTTCIVSKREFSEPLSYTSPEEIM